MRNLSIYIEGANPRVVNIKVEDIDYLTCDHSNGSLVLIVRLKDETGFSFSLPLPITNRQMNANPCPHWEDLRHQWEDLCSMVADQLNKELKGENDVEIHSDKIKQYYNDYEELIINKLKKEKKYENNKNRS